MYADLGKLFFRKLETHSLQSADPFMFQPVTFKLVTVFSQLYSCLEHKSLLHF